MIRCGSCQGRHETVAQVRECSGQAGGVLTDERPEPTSYGQAGIFNPAGAPTQPMLDFLRNLLNERECSEREREAWAAYLEPESNPTKHGVRTAIERLKSYPRRQRQSGSRITEDGMYRMDGTIFKVQFAVHGSGNLYAKRLIVDERATDTALAVVHFEYDRGAVARLRPEHRMTLEEAQEFGKLYGVCCVCGRTLTDEGSIAAGIGPVCGGKV